MQMTIKAAAVAVTALSALATALVTKPATPAETSSPLATPSVRKPTMSRVAVQHQASLLLASGPSANIHGAPHPLARTTPPTAPELRPELHDAYWLAVQSAPTGCRPPFSLLAAVGMVESASLAGRAVDSRNRVSPAVIGPALNGRGLPAVRDTDAGRIDSDRVWDRAVGPMQLVPEVWRAAAVDMDGDGTRDPQNVFDAAGAAMVYLCAQGRDLSTRAGMEQAVRSYNRRPGYVRLVLAWKAAYDRQLDQLVDVQAVLGAVAPVPVKSPGDAKKGPASRVLALNGRTPRAPTTETPSATVPEPSSGPLISVPSKPEHSSAEPVPAGPSDPSPAPAAQTPGVGAVEPTRDPRPRRPRPTPQPGRTPEPGASPEPTPSSTPDPAPSCVLPPEEEVAVDPRQADPTALCPAEETAEDPTTPPAVP